MDKKIPCTGRAEEWGRIKDGVYTQSTPEKGKEAKKWVIMNLSDEAIGPVEISRPVPTSGSQTVFSITN